MKNIHIYIGIILLLFGCKKEIGPQSVNPDEKGSGKLIVINEGNFGFGNASVSIYNPSTGEIANNQYRAANGVGIGDVLQSVNRYQDRLYFVVNNSGKVVVTDTNLKLITEIPGFNSPRYIEFYGNKAFVTDLKQKAVYVVNLLNYQITNQIPTQGWTEHIVLYQNRLYVMDRGDYLSNSGPNYIYEINPISLIKEDSIQVGTNPNSMILDNNNLWVLSSGKGTIEKPKLQRMNVLRDSIDFSYTFPSYSDNPSRLCYDDVKDELYFINSSVYKVTNDTSSFNPILFFQKTTENFYGLSVIQGIIYATDAKNYNQSGDINIFNNDGLKINKVTSSIIPQLVR